MRCFKKKIIITYYYILLLLITIIIITFFLGLLLVTKDKKLFVLKLTVGFNTNLNINAERKRDKYQQFQQALNSQFSFVKFVNLSVRCFGIFGYSADSFIDMCKELEINKSYLCFIIRKTSNKII